ncbi:ExeA family protein [Alkalimarinus coralli]|uniref:ExeA family protein n=1 Tax=Alkalimarinus coralli TaxID=2935863 RepID=UPI0023DFE4F8|nr:ExeA family protein [Alkalimarinus coralli]
MSERHKEALAHLLYGVSGQGGFVVLTGEVGTGKTTVCRCFLQQVPDNTDVAFIVNPKLSARELLANICDEFGIQHPHSASIKIYNDLISHYLLQAHSEGRHTVLVIDEAQNLRIDVLEQLRLLTNLETSEKKLLQIILLGQPELQDMLAQKELRQLAQRITARYHLKALNKEEVTAYIRYRLAVAGQKQDLFKPGAIKTIYRKSGGIPRLINLVCDRALLGAYSQSATVVDAKNIKQAFNEIGAEQKKNVLSIIPKWVVTGAGMGAVFGALLIFLVAGFLGKDKELYSDRLSDGDASNQDIAQTNSALDDASNTTALQAAEYSERCVEGDDSCDTGTEGAHVPRPLNSSFGTVNRSGFDPKKRYGTDYVGSLKYTAPPFNNKLTAYQAVLSVWGVNYTQHKSKLVCEFAELQGLGCLHKQGNWRGLLQINRPTVMKLSNQKGQPFYIGLLAIEGDYAKVAIGNKTIWTSLDAIDQQWYGDYSVIWKLPPYKSRVITPGTVNDPDKWLNSNITNVKASQASQKGAETAVGLSDNSPIQEKIQWFQRSEGLTPDGIAGALTLIHLNNYINPDIPTLVRKSVQPGSPRS